MNHAAISASDAAADARQVLAGADQRLTAVADAMERLAILGPDRLLDDETVARVRGLTGDLAAQLSGFDQALIGPVHEMLAGNRAVLTHCHALAVEWRLAMTLAAHLALDPVLSPLLQRHSATMIALVAEQTRWFEATRRMHVPLADLPADLQHLAWAIVRAARADHAIAGSPDMSAARDDHLGRLAQLHRAVAGLGDDIDRALRVDDAGVSLFLTALAIASGHPRETVVLATAEKDPIRLALLLCAAGLSREDAARQMLILRPDADPALVDAAYGAFSAETRAGIVQ